MCERGHSTLGPGNFSPCSTPRPQSDRSEHRGKSGSSGMRPALAAGRQRDGSERLLTVRGSEGEGPTGREARPRPSTRAGLGRQGRVRGSRGLGGHVPPGAEGIAKFLARHGCRARLGRPSSRARPRARGAGGATYKPSGCVRCVRAPGSTPLPLLRAARISRPPTSLKNKVGRMHRPLVAVKLGMLAMMAKIPSRSLFFKTRRRPDSTCRARTQLPRQSASWGWAAHQKTTQVCL